MKELLKAQETLRKHGIRSTINEFSFGVYYDGEQHHESYPGLFIECDNYNQYAAIESILERNKNIVIEYRNYNTLHKRIMIASDYKKAMKAQEKANTFLDAFWQAIHEHKTQDEAIKAGQKAIA